MEIPNGGRSETESFFYGEQTGNSEPSETERFFSGQEDTDRLRLAHDASLSIDPGKAQRVLKLEKETGLEQDLIDRNLEDVEKEQKRKTFDAAAVQSQFPTTATWYGKNPNHAAVVGKYLDSATKLERAFQERGTLESIGQSVIKGLNSMNQSLAQAPALAYDVAALPQNLAVKAIGRPDLQVRAPEWLRNNSVAEYYKDQSEMIQLPELDLSVSQLISNGDFSSAARTMAVQAAASAPNLMALFAANYLSGGAASLATAGILSASGSATEAAEQGADPAMSTVNAVTQGTIEATAERLGTLGIFSKWEGAIARAHGKQAAGEVMKDFAKTIVASIGIEGLEEGVTSIGQDISAYSTGVNPNALKGTSQRAVDSFFLGGFMGLGMGGVGTTLGAGSRLKSVADAQRAKVFYSSLGNSEEASELRSQLPEQHRELVENLTKDSPVENVYIPVEEFQSYFQSANENPTAIAQVLGVSESYNEAVETGGDLKVPLSVWTDKFIGTNHYKGLENNIKFSPDALTFNQSTALRETIRKEMEAQAPTEAGTQTAQTEPDPIFQDVFNQVRGLNLENLGEKEAQIYATTVSSFFRNMGARSGVDPVELYNRYGLQISSDALPAMPSLESQGAQFAPEFDESGNQVFDPENLAYLRRIVSEGELVKSGAIPDEDGMAVGYYAGTSTFPDFFQNKGYTKKETLAILDKFDSGKPLTEKQTAILSDLYNGMMEGLSRGNMYQEPIPLDSAGLQRDLKAQAEEFFSNPETREKLKEEYRSRPETLKGRLLDTDAARELWPEYRDNPNQRSILSEATDSAAGNLVREMYEEILASQPESSLVVLMGGGPGSGKSESLKKNTPHLRNLDAIYDSVSGNVDVLRERIEQALASGRRVDYGYVYAPLDEAMAWIEKRFNETGRPVDPEYVAWAHVMAQEAALQIAEEYGDNPLVNVQLYDNSSGTKTGVLKVEELRALRYTGANETPEQAIQRLLPEVKERLKDVQARVEKTRQEAISQRAGKNLSRAVGEGEQSIGGIPGRVRGSNEGSSEGNGPVSFDQSGHTPRGRIQFGKDRKFKIDLFKHFDLSTFLHETGHFYMEVMGDLAQSENAPQQIKDDYQTILDWMGVKSRDEIQVEHHEKWARGFEMYLREGKAPSDKLRQAFARIKIWLTQVYKRMTDLNVEISPEIRSVMDRMLSSQEEIQAAYGQQNSLPLFSDPRAVGMTEAQAERYMEARFEAQRAAEEILLAKLMEDHAREQRAIWKENWQKIEAKYEAEANSNPAYIALAILQKGTMPDGSALPEGSTAFKLSKEDILNEVGKEGLKRLPRPYVYSTENGIPLSVAAEILGFESGDALYQSLISTPKKSEWVKNQTQAEMDQLFPDLLTSPLLKEEAVKAIHNDKLDELRRLELEHMASNNLPALKDVIRKVARRVPTTQMVREEAERFVGQKKVGELQPHVYRLAETKSAKLAGEAVAKGEFDAAFDHKQRERLNAALFRAATEAKEEQAKAFKFFKKLNRSDAKIAENRDVDFVNAARAILARFGIGQAEKTATEYLSMTQKYDPEAYSTVMTIVNSATENAIPYKELKMDDFFALRESVEAIWDLAKSQRQMLIDGRVADRAEVEAEIFGRIADLQKGEAKVLPGTAEAITDEEKRTISVRSLVNLATRVEHWAYAMDGGDPSGPFTKYVARPIFNATAEYRVKKVETLEKLREIVKGIDFGDPNVKILAPEIGYKFTKPELIMALLHTGNDSNLKKLLVGRGWGKLNEDRSLDRSRWDAMIYRMQKTGVLTKADYDAVQAIWDLNESLKPNAQKAFKRLNGHYFNEVTANSFMTEFGEYRGGYMPAIADPAISMDADARAGQSLEDNPAHMFPTTGKGFTKSRIENYTTPLSLDFSKIQSHIDKVLRFSYIEPAVRDVYKIMNGREMRAEVKSVASDAVNDLIVPWLKRASTQKAALPGMSQKFDRAMSFFRRSSSIQFMVLNIANAFQNTTGLFPSLTYVGAKHMAGSFRRYLSDRKGYANSVMESSKYMQTRIGENAAEVQRDIDDLVTNPSKFKQFTDASIKHGYFADRLTNSMVEVVVWGAAYNQAIQEEAEHAEAVQRADSVVRKGIAGMNSEDASKYEGGTPFVRLFTMFSSFFNTQMNVAKAEIEIARQDGFSSPEGQKRLVRTYTFVLAIPAILSALIMRAMSGAGLDEDDDGEYFDDIVDLFFISQVKYAAAMLPGGTVVNTAFNQFNDKAYDDKINLSPALSNLEKALKAPKSILSAADGGNMGNAVRDSFAAFGLATGYPAGAVARPVGYAADVIGGKSEPSGPIDLVRGLVTGRGPK